MSSFKRRAPAASTSTSLPGCRPSLYTGLPLTSTGVPSLDDLLGGGLPLGSTLLVSEDADGSYAKLLLRYWIAQGLAVGQDVVVVGSSNDEGGDPKEVVRRLMGVVGRGDVKATGKGKEKASTPVDSDEEGLEDGKARGNMKIAWRYEGLGKHDEGLEEARPQNTAVSGEYCSAFDLTKTFDLSTEVESRLHLVDASEHFSLMGLKEGLAQLAASQSPKRALRIAIQSLGSLGGPEASDPDLFAFLTTLRTLTRGSGGAPKASAMVTYPAALRSSATLRKLQWATDGCIALESFAGNIASQLAFPNHQGIITLPRLPSPHSLVPPSTKSNVLHGGKDSNLGFRVGRRRGFKIELMGLGIEGGVSERRTELPAVEPTSVPPASAAVTEREREKTSARFANPGEKDDEAEVALEAKPRRGGLKKSRPKVRFGAGDDEPAPSQEHPVKHLGNTEW